jgi:hypothetical protein
MSRNNSSKVARLPTVHESEPSMTGGMLRCRMAAIFVHKERDPSSSHGEVAVGEGTMASEEV